MWLMLQHDVPEDFVVATGVQHTVRECAELAFKANGIELVFEGEGMEEKAYDKKTGKMMICVNAQWFRPTDVVNLLGDPSKAKEVLNWDPQKTSFEELIRIMAEHDRKLAKRERAMMEADKR